MIMKQISYVVTLVLIVLTFSSHAFKIDTHVYIGQQVIDDLQDGHLTFTLGEEEVSFPVDEKVKQAILGNPSIYRAGNMGPDVFPDFLSGQVIVHPGIPNSWQTSDWLKYIVDEANTHEEIAFAYGYLGHAASDIFAHTYVNRYAGGVFDLFDDSYDIEIRHILLEQFIIEKTPNFAEKFQLDVPENFIVDKLINNSTVSSVYGSNDATNHLKWFYKLKQEVRDLQESDILKQLDIEVTKYIVQAATGIRINKDIAEKLIKIDNEITGLKKDSIELAGKIHGELLRIDGQVNKWTGKTVVSLIRNLDSAISEAKRAYDRYHDAQMKVIDILKDPVPEKIKEEICPRTRDFWSDARDDGSEIVAAVIAPVVVIPTLVATCYFEEIANPLFKPYEEALRLEKRAVDKLSEEVNDEIEEVKQIAKEITATLVATHKAYRKTIEASYELFAEMHSDSNPIRSLLIMWENNIDRSVAQYVDHMYRAMIETMNENGNPMPILKEWISCWAWGLVSVPTQLTKSVCTIEDSYKRVSETLDKVIAHINPVTELALKLKEKITAEIGRAGKKILTKLIEEMLDDKKVLKVMKTLLAKGVAEKLTTAYSEDTSNYGLLLIPDIVKRVTTEMHLTQTGEFDPNKYPVIYNAIVMTKLTLLSHSQLNELVINAGINTPTLYGDTLYPEYDNGNILFNAIRSIDGNHQWSEYAPQPVYRQDYQRGKDKNELRFGFGFDSYSGTGMRIWQDQNVRDKLFRKIFIGPLVPGVDAPDNIGFSRINAMVNNYHTCIERPFPDGDNDKACIKPKVTQEPSPQIVAHINQCISKFSGYFGTKVDSAFSCSDDNYFCQKTTGGTEGDVVMIAINKSEYDVFWYLMEDKWNKAELSLCKPPAKIVAHIDKCVNKFSDY